MRLKLFKKYFFATTVIILVSLTAMTGILSFVLNSYITDTKKNDLRVACREISEHISLMEQSGQNSLNQLSSTLKTIASISNSEIFIVGTDGKLLVCACEDWEQYKSCRHSDARLLKTEQKTVESGKIALSTLGIYGRPHYVSSVKLSDKDNNVYGSAYVTAPVAAVKNLLSAISRLYLLSAIIPIIVMFFAIYAMTYRLTKPLKLMSEASYAMAKGDFSKRIPVMSDDEIGELSESFNMMTNSLSRMEGMRKSFVANVSHELRTPLTTIGGFIDGILDGTIEGNKQKYYLDIVADEVKRMTRLIESMLSMSKLESGEFALNSREFDLRELIFTIVIGQEQRIEKKRLDIVGLDEIPAISINADKDLIHQAIYNLLDNAIKFTPEKGKISFELKKENKKTVFTITNTGDGIPQKDIPFVFERFYKVDKSRSASKNSTGLGLYIVKTIVTAHGGIITVSAKENEYTSFKVTLI